MATAVKLGKIGRQALTREKLSTLAAEIRTILAFADLNAAAAAYATSKGEVLLADDPEAVGWTAAAHDEHVARALALVHGAPERDWTIATLGAEVGLSRSSFAARFQSVMGQPPLTYLTTWRMHRARGLLRDPAISIAQIASRVGYASAAAFTAAFKRDTGDAPGAWRRRAAA